MQYVTLGLYILATLGAATFALAMAKRFGIAIAYASFAGVIAVSNIIASKIVTFGPFVVPAAVLMYASSFLITDVISEVWGKRYAYLAVIGGLFANMFLILGCSIAIAWPPAPFWKSQEAFASILGAVPRIVIASIIGYIISQTHDVIAFHFWKKKTHGKHLWFRNCASTTVSQFLDTTVFITIAFWGIAPVLPLIIGQYLVKVIVALSDTPFCYLAVHILKRRKKR